MHILFVHPNFPAQFGHIAAHLAGREGWKATYVSQVPPGQADGLERIQYKPAGGATTSTNFNSRTFENAVWHTQAVFDALKARPDVQPDLIVGHSGFGSTLFLPELYPRVPVINLFEYYYRPHHPESDMDFRKDLGWVTPESNYLRSRCRNAMILLDLQSATAGYTPTQFQKSCFPAEYHPKLNVIFDGIDRAVYRSLGEPFRAGRRIVAGQEIDSNTRIVTYVARGFEAMRGFDIFMRAAKIIAREMPNVVFFVVGTDRHAYGGDEAFIGDHKSFREWTLAQQDYDLSRFFFTGRVPQNELARLLSASDLHIYLTVPFVLSWSLMNAMSCGAVVLGSDTPPVREMLRDGENGLLADFFSPEDFAAKALRVLHDPAAHRRLGQAAEQMIQEQYSLEAVLPKMLKLYESVLG